MSKYVYILFLVSVFLFRLPNFYLFPPFRSDFLTSQAIARIFSGLVFLWNIYFGIRYKKKSTILPHSLTINLIFLFFFIESISIIPAINIASFLQRYKDIFIGLTFFINGYIYKDKLNEIFLVLLMALPINIVYELLMYFSPELFIKFGSIFIYSKHFSLVMFNMSRGRTYIETFNELLLPFLFYLIKQNNTSRYMRLIFYILIALIMLCAYISSWRIRIIMILFGCITSLFFFHRKNTKVILLTLLTMVFFGYFVNYISLQFSNISFISRFTDENFVSNPSVTTTIDFRKEQVLNAIELSKKSFIGVGLGNYFDNLSNNTKQPNSIQWINEDKVALEFVHNNFGTIIAETGVIGLIIFTLLIVVWAISDLHLLMSRSGLSKVPVLSFWILFLFGVFNPTNIGAYQVFFLMIRAFLI